jgi:hypothetical protein
MHMMKATLKDCPEIEGPKQLKLRRSAYQCSNTFGIPHIFHIDHAPQLQAQLHQ